MNVSDLPMVFFTVVTQMAVGAFLVLGVVQCVNARKHSAEVMARVSAPVLYAIGPALVLGLIVSMFHMNDVTHTLYVILHWKTSWLSREILFGCAFAGVGFVFALLEWFGKGAHALRQVIAVIAALLGIGLVVSQSMIYYSLVVIPAWHSWAVPFQFGATAVLLGCIGVDVALMATGWVRLRTTEPVADAASASLGGKFKARLASINAPASEEEQALTLSVAKASAAVAAIVAVAILVAYPLYLGGLGQGNAASVAAAAVFSGKLFWCRLVLAAIAAVLLGVFVYASAGEWTASKAKMLTFLVTAGFVIAILGEFAGRMLHYLAMVKAGL